MASGFGWSFRMQINFESNSFVVQAYEEFVSHENLNWFHSLCETVSMMDSTNFSMVPAISVI